MWWLIIQRFPRCRNPFMGIFNELHQKTDNRGRDGMPPNFGDFRIPVTTTLAHRLEPDRSCYSVSRALRSRQL